MLRHTFFINFLYFLLYFFRKKVSAKNAEAYFFYYISYTFYTFYTLKKKVLSKNSGATLFF